MIEGLYSALSASKAQELRLEVISNNLANMSTVGYKRDIPVFRTILNSAQDNLQTAPPAALPVSSLENLILMRNRSSYVLLDNITTDFKQGVFKETGNSLDVAINGDGFFAVETPQGTRYTRQGNFTLDSSSRLVTEEGHPVLSNGEQEIIIEGTKIEISDDGEISVDGKTAGRVGVTDFPKPYLLTKVGNSLFSSSEDGFEAKEYGVKQGFLELSNINVIGEMVNMIDSLRSFESYQKLIKMSMEVVTSKAANEIGRVRG